MSKREYFFVSILLLLFMYWWEFQEKKFSLFSLFLFLSVAMILFFGTDKGFSFFEWIFRKNSFKKFPLYASLHNFFNYIVASDLGLIYVVFAFFKTLLLFMLPFFIVLWKNKNLKDKTPSVRDFLAVAILMIPIFVNLKIRLIFGFFNWIFFTLEILIIFLIVRGFSRFEIGYRFDFDLKDFGYLIFGFFLWFSVKFFLLLGFDFETFFQILMLQSFENASYKFFIYFPYFTVLIALNEELIHRGIILNFLKAKWKNLRFGIYIALIVSSLIFGLIHMPQKGYIALRDAFFSGLIFGSVYLKTEKLVTPILLHSLANTFMMIIL